MKKQIIMTAALSVVIFIFTLWLSLPYENFVLKGLGEAERQAKVSITYSDIDSGPLSTTLEDLQVNDIPVGNVKVSYSPFRLMTGSIGYSAAGAVNAKGKLSAGSFTLDGSISSGVLNKLIEDAEFTGDIKADVKADLSEMKADIAASADKVKLQTPMGPMEFEKIDIEAGYDKNTVTLKKLTSQDSMELNLKGTIRVNTRMPDKSFVDLNGTFNLIGQEKQIRLKGRADKLEPSIS